MEKKDKVEDFCWSQQQTHSAVYAQAPHCLIPLGIGLQRIDAAMEEVALSVENKQLQMQTWQNGDCGPVGQPSIRCFL